MPAEPNHPMDERLRKHARERRETPGAPSSLHPANRKALQAEVRQVYGSRTGRPAGDSSPAGWWFRWPGLVAIGSFVVVVGLGVALWSGNERHADYQMAKLEEVAPLAQDKALSAAPSAPSLEPPPAAAVPPPAPPRERFAASPAAEPPRPTSTPERSIARNRAESKALPAVAPMTPAPAPAPVVLADRLQDARANLPIDSALGSIDSNVSDPAALNLNFRRVEIPPPAKPAAGAKPGKADVTPALLTQFQLSLQNGQVQIVDQDGSTYTGTMQPQKTPVSSARRGDAGALAKAKDGVATNQTLVTNGSYAFQAIGTNRSSRQAVRVEGELRQNALATLTGDSLASQAQSSVAGSAARNFQSQSQSQSVGQAYSWEFRSTVSSAGRSQQLNAIQIPTNAPTSNAGQYPR